MKMRLASGNNSGNFITNGNQHAKSRLHANGRMSHKARGSTMRLIRMIQFHKAHN